MPSIIYGNSGTAVVDHFDKPEGTHLVGNFYEWMWNQPGNFGGGSPTAQVSAATASGGVVGCNLHGSSGFGGEAFTQKIYGHTQRISCRLLSVGADGHEEFSMYIKYNFLTNHYYRCVWYTGSGPTYHLAYNIGAGEVSINGFTGWSPSVGSRLSFQWQSGTVSISQNDSVIASFSDSNVPGPGHAGFGFYNENATAGTVTADDFMVESPFGVSGSWSGSGPPVPQLGWDL